MKKYTLFAFLCSLMLFGSCSKSSNNITVTVKLSFKSMISGHNESYRAAGKDADRLFEIKNLVDGEFANFYSESAEYSATGSSDDEAYNNVVKQAEPLMNNEGQRAEGFMVSLYQKLKALNLDPDTKIVINDVTFCFYHSEAYSSTGTKINARDIKVDNLGDFIYP